jgi:CRISPR/Cas system-associated endonuclease Cas3-HD
MKAKEALTKLNRVNSVFKSLTVLERKSKVDETKTLGQMLQSWLNLFENYPEMNVTAIMKYNVNKDFDCL